MPLAVEVVHLESFLEEVEAYQEQIQEVACLEVDEEVLVVVGVKVVMKMHQRSLGAGQVAKVADQAKVEVEEVEEEEL